MHNMRQVIPWIEENINVSVPRLKLFLQHYENIRSQSNDLVARNAAAAAVAEFEFQRAAQAQAAAAAAVAAMGHITANATTSIPGSNSNHGDDVESPRSGDGGAGSVHSASAGGGAAKPSVGTEEWLKQRRENHKEVERRRRETINEGINELAKLIPDNGEKNKGKIIARAVAYIEELKQNEATHLEKWTVEKLLCEQAIQELSATLEVVREENIKLREQNAELVSMLKVAGLDAVNADMATKKRRLEEFLASE
ncbi:basic helix-loop-helix protein [Blyttiomyces sp. JEL0837]|nr:basic helix-loop-helix protein [Blyttiomyces sp. JEL0837]